MYGRPRDGGTIYAIVPTVGMSSCRGIDEVLQFFLGFLSIFATAMPILSCFVTVFTYVGLFPGCVCPMERSHRKR